MRLLEQLSLRSDPSELRQSSYNKRPTWTPRRKSPIPNCQSRPSLDFPFCSPHNGSMALTQRQKGVLDFIADFIKENGYSPSYEELSQGLHLASLAPVHKHIQALESRTYLRRLFNQSRSLEVSAKYVQERRKGRATARAGDIPLAGRIAAGVPVE